MFNNPGMLIKIVAKTLTIIGIGVSVIGAFAILMEAEELVMSLGVLVGGALSSWLAGLFIYGFGELIENTGTY